MNNVSGFPSASTVDDNASQIFLTQNPHPMLLLQWLMIIQLHLLVKFFSSYSEAVESYYHYATHVEFSIRLSSTENSNSKEDGKKVLLLRRLLRPKLRDNRV